MSFEGMDIDEVAELARQLDANARTLTGIAALLGGLAEALGQQWRGPARPPSPATSRRATARPSSPPPSSFPTCTPG